MQLNLNLNFAEVTALAAVGSVIPIIQTVFGGDQTPVGLYEKLSDESQSTFLLESAEQGVWSRYSFIGVQSRISIRETLAGLEIHGTSSILPTQQELSADSLVAIEQIQAAWKNAHIESLPPLTSGLVGFFGWDIIRKLEQFDMSNPSTYECPNLQLELVRDVIALDHKTSNILIISNIYVCEDTDLATEYEAASNRILEMYERISAPSAPSLGVASEFDAQTSIKTLTSQTEFVNMVELAKERVVAGDVFQVVLSQRLELELRARALDVYKVLRSLNPSPYMYLLNFRDGKGSYSVVGSSPEALVKVNSGIAVMHPIAGSRPRGKSPEEDLEFERSLLDDAKERAEHLMLVDLARNDLLKVCEPDSISVTEFMKVERFSHIMHLVSTVQGKISQGKSPVSVFKATFPAGTLSGAPKPMALEVIEELESFGRGVFGGVVGYLDFSGNSDLAICIRTAFLRDGVAHIQAGAGIVLDSVPELEYEETMHKMSAVITAVDKSNRLFGQPRTSPAL